jgi:hypothetical protein
LNRVFIRGCQSNSFRALILIRLGLAGKEKQIRAVSQSGGNEKHLILAL